MKKMAPIDKSYTRNLHTACAGIFISFYFYFFILFFIYFFWALICRFQWQFKFEWCMAAIY